jgi:hypothetical protein
MDGMDGWMERQGKEGGGWVPIAQLLYGMYVCMYVCVGTEGVLGADGELGTFVAKQQQQQFTEGKGKGKKSLGHMMREHMDWIGNPLFSPAEGGLRLG